MPSVKQPRRLEDLALTGVADWVAKIGEDLMPSISEISRRDNLQSAELLASGVACLKEILDINIPWMLYDKFGEEIFRSISNLLEKTKASQGFRGSMSKFMSKMNVAVSLTEVLLTRNLTRLNLDEVPKMMKHIFYVKFSNLRGLKLLNLGSLSGGWKTTDMEPTIVSGLKALSNLVDLTINYDCTNNILQTLCDHCPKLRSLDVTSSKSISNQSVGYLIRFPELRRVQLYRTGVTIEGFTKLLLNCPKMEDLGRCDELGRCLEYIDVTNSSAGPFALRKYVSRFTTSDQLHILVNLCPKLYSVSVFHNSLLSDLTILIGLPELTELKLLSCDFFADQIKHVLEVKGCNITHLHLEHVDQLDMNALMYISRFCPCLESLTLYNCVLVQHTSLFTRKIDWAPFYSLERLMCVCEGTEEQLEFLLGNCVNIKSIHLGTAVRTTDRLFDRVLEKNAFLFLEELRILQSDELTMSTVSRLLSSCGQLRVLAELECWTCLTETDLEYIRSYIKINNLDLDISPFRQCAT